MWQLSGMSERQRWVDYVERIAREHDCSIEAVYEWLGRVLAIELDIEADDTLH